VVKSAVIAGLVESAVRALEAAPIGDDSDVRPSVRLAEADVARVAEWVELVRQTGRRMDLTAARDDRELVDLMVADALVLARLLPERQRVVDVGAGAGAPGLGLALMRPDLSVTMVEPLEKRVTFLRTVIGRACKDRPAPLPVVIRARGEAVAGRSFDIAVSRATLPPAAWLELGLRLAPQAFVLLAQAEPPERADALKTIDVRYAWPLTGAERRIAGYARRPPT
jgi:16S rRNA (guanine527-N7)-methyltransferase